MAPPEFPVSFPFALFLASESRSAASWVRARNLYNAGFRTFKDIRGSTVEELSKVPALGKAIAEDIKRNLAEKA